MAEPRVVLAGNPNSGKTTLFNRLTGLALKVGNYPGVTVDRHEGRAALPSRVVLLEDLPGTYSLSSRSAEEEIAIRALTGQGAHELPAAAVVVVDGTQLGRSLALVLEVLELGLPTVLAVNMADELARSGQRLDVERLGSLLGLEAVAIVARTGRGVTELCAALERTLASGRIPPLPEAAAVSELEPELATIEAALPDGMRGTDPRRARALARWALLSIDDEDELEAPETLRRVVGEQRASALARGLDPDLALVRPRFTWIDAHLPGLLVESNEERTPWSVRADRVLLHPLLGLPLFLLVMAALFQSLFAWSDPLIGAIEGVFGALSGWVQASFEPSILRDLVTEGLIAGVGSVVVFLPQILLLFLFLGILEATGYMARVAWLMDRLMRSMGLTGRAFVPMLSGFACAIPAIMATRTMERRRDRLKTMMVVPLMTCSARLPVYTLIIGALFPTEVWLGLSAGSLLMVAMYLFGTLVALAAAAVLSRTILQGPSVPLVFELPPYRMPQVGPVLRGAWNKGLAFLREAGTVIFVATIALWALLSFPRVDEQPGQSEEQLHAAQLEESLAGDLGKGLEPLLEPLGFDWKIGVGLIGAFAAREVFVSTLGLVYGVGGDVDEESTSLRERIRAAARPDGSRVFTPLVGLSLLVFFALACQCLSTLAVVKRETNGWRWPVFLLAYMTALAWGASFVVYQGGRLLGYA